MRNTCKDASSVAYALRPFIMAADAVDYSKEDNARLCRKGIRKHKKLIMALLAVVPNLSVSKVTLKAAVRQVYEDNKVRMHPSGATEWISDTTRRLKNLMRHVQQMRIGRHPEWFNKLNLFSAEGQHDEGDEDECGEEESSVSASDAPASDAAVDSPAAETPEAAPQPLEPYVGYDAQLKKAWRRRSDTSLEDPPILLRTPMSRKERWRPTRSQHAGRMACVVTFHSAP